MVAPTANYKIRQKVPAPQKKVAHNQERGLSRGGGKLINSREKTNLRKVLQLDAKYFFFIIPRLRNAQHPMENCLLLDLLVLTDSPEWPSRCLDVL